MRHLNAESTKTLLGKIRHADARTLTVKNPLFENLDGKATVLQLKSGNDVLGTIHAKTRRDAASLMTSKEVNLTIGWDKNRNEKILADFVR